jgi:hypothetical protein
MLKQNKLKMSDAFEGFGEKEGNEIMDTSRVAQSD